MKSMPRIKIAHLPTVIEPLTKLTHLFGGPKLYIKRDDQTGLAFGGNKTRKLEFLIADAQSHGAKSLITAGALQSNHCRQTAAAAAHFGLQCTLVLTGDPPTETSGNLMLDKLFGAQIIYSSRKDRDEVLQNNFNNSWEKGERPYLVPYGGSNPIGACAYVHAIEELVEQGLKPDWIIFASSSGGTQAGMTLGAQLHGFSGRILGISVDETSDTLCNLVSSLANETAELIGSSIHLSAKDILVNDNYLGQGYGIMGDMEKEAIHLFARYEGILLDPVYTGRAAAGLLDLIQKGNFSKDEVILFWHTGGTPALFASKYQDIIG